jgi:exodeoxyribonuclease VII small subunit
VTADKTADRIPADIAKMTFEQAMSELEGLVAKLEGGETPLDESIALYERGAALREHCDRRLRDAEMRVEKITQGSNGPKTQPFATE